MTKGKNKAHDSLLHGMSRNLAVQGGQRLIVVTSEVGWLLVVTSSAMALVHCRPVAATALRTSGFYAAPAVVEKIVNLGL